MRVALYICLTCFSVMAQEGLTPPPTRIALPSDTTLTTRQALQKLEADSSQIELPDVVVKGQNTSQRQVDQKRTSRSEQPKLIQPGEAYEAVSAWLRRSNEKMNAGDSPFKDQITWLVLQAGSYTSLQARGGHWRRWRQGQIHGHGWFDQSHGQYNNSGFRQGGLTGKIEYRLSELAKGQMQFQYDRYQRGLHGAFLHDGKRNGGQGGVDLELSVEPRPLTNLRMNMEIKGLSVNSDTSGHRLEESDDFYYYLAVGAQQVWSKWQLALQGRYLRESYDTTRDSTALVASFREVNLNAIYPFSANVQLSAGLALQGFGADSTEQINSLSPFAQVRFSPNDRFAVALQGRRGMLYQTYMQRRIENPYLSHGFLMEPEESRFTLRLESEIAIAKTSHLDFLVAKSWMDRLLFWQQEQTTGLFEQGRGSGSLAEIRTSFHTQPTAKTQIRLSLAGYTDQLDESNLPTNQQRVPYRPNVKMALQGRYFPAADWTLTGEVNYWSDRASRVDSDQRLPDFALIEVSVQKKLGRFIIAWLTVQNVVDSRYVLWENYTEPGFMIHSGIRAQF